MDSENWLILTSTNWHITTHSGFLLMRNFKWDNKFFQGEFIPYKYRKNIILWNDNYQIFIKSKKGLTIYKSLINKEEGGLDFDLGFPYIYFTEFNKEKDRTTFFAGIQLIEDLPLQKEMKKVTVPNGQYLLSLHLGPRSKRQQTVNRMLVYAKSKKLTLDSKQLEVMLNDPKETDSVKLISRIYIPIIKK